MQFAHSANRPFSFNGSPRRYPRFIGKSLPNYSQCPTKRSERMQRIVSTFTAKNSFNLNICWLLFVNFSFSQLSSTDGSFIRGIRVGGGTDGVKTDTEKSKRNSKRMLFLETCKIVFLGHLSGMFKRCAFAKDSPLVWTVANDYLAKIIWWIFFVKHTITPARLALLAVNYRLILPSRLFTNRGLWWPSAFCSANLRTWTRNSIGCHHWDGVQFTETVYADGPATTCSLPGFWRSVLAHS